MPASATHIGHVKKWVAVLDAQVSLAEGQAVRVEPLSSMDLAADAKIESDNCDSYSINGRMRTPNSQTTRPTGCALL